jgi:hypothetical protein
MTENDEHWMQRSPVQASERGARYDGVLCFDPEWIIVIENKLYAETEGRQAVNISLPETHEIELDTHVVVLLWRDVVNRLTTLLDAGVLGKAERTLLDDFLEFLDTYFDYLNPYDTFGRCNESELLLEKRCKKILEAIAPGRVAWARGWSAWYMKLTPADSPTKMCGLYPRQTGEGAWSIQLTMYPGDVMTAAREFYKYLSDSATEQFLNLQNTKWAITPNFHLGFIRTGLGHRRGLLPIEQYLTYWRGRLIQQIFPDEQGRFQPALQPFTHDGLIGETDVEDICSQAAKLGATNLNVCPGVEVLFRWPLADAVAIDKTGGMVGEVRTRANEAIVTWGGDQI